MTEYSVETEQETDGRWTAEITNLPGVMAYGSTERAAIRALLTKYVEVARSLLTRNARVAVNPEPNLNVNEGVGGLNPPERSERRPATGKLLFPRN
ncbi:MAG: hypothetical protein WB992_14515 [Bryobacteraceae bacterium]